MLRTIYKSRKLLYFPDKHLQISQSAFLQFGEFRSSPPNRKLATKAERQLLPRWEMIFMAPTAAPPRSLPPPPSTGRRRRKAEARTSFPALTLTGKRKKRKQEQFPPLDLMEPFKKEEKENPLRKISPSKCCQGKKFNHVFTWA